MSAQASAELQFALSLLIVIGLIAAAVAVLVLVVNVLTPAEGADAAFDTLPELPGAVVAERSAEL